MVSFQFYEGQNSIKQVSSLAPLQTKEAQLKVAEMELSKVDNKTKVETLLQEEAVIRQDNKDREMERLADAAEKVARVMTLHVFYFLD